MVFTSGMSDMHMKGLVDMMDMKETSMTSQPADGFVTSPSEVDQCGKRLDQYGGGGGADYVVEKTPASCKNVTSQKLSYMVNYFAHHTSLHGVRFVATESQHTFRR